MKDEFNKVNLELENEKKGCQHHHHHHHDHDHECGNDCKCDHDHDCDDNCECGCDHDEPVIYVTFDDEGDEEVPCVVLDIFECNGRNYIAISPKADVDEEDEAEVYFYRFSEDGEEVQLDDIETEEEWNAVADLFDKNFFGVEGEEE